jgi:hypothetical protein
LEDLNFVIPRHAATVVGGTEHVSVFDTTEPDNCRKTVRLELNPYKNDKYDGNVLIVQERRAGEPNSCPLDSGAGGSISFEFCQPVFFQSATLVFHYSTSSAPTTVDVPDTGDKGVFTDDYNESHVTKLEVIFSVSCSVSCTLLLVM